MGRTSREPTAPNVVDMQPPGRAKAPEQWETWRTWEAPVEEKKRRALAEGRTDTGQGVTVSNADNASDPTIVAMNEEFCVVKVGANTRVASRERIESQDPSEPPIHLVVLQSFGEFSSFHNRNRVVVENGSDKTKPVGKGTFWLQSPHRRQYKGVTYQPDCDSAVTPDGRWNLWTGFGVEANADAGSCEKFKAHLLSNICNGVDVQYNYLMQWLAWAVQNPGRRAEIAVVVRGEEGTGKGIFAGQAGLLFGKHFLQVTRAEHLTGRFNSHLQQCSFLFVDEAYFAGDRSTEGALKAIITEKVMMIEPKGTDPYPVRNCLHVVMSSNSDWVVPAGPHARRYFVLDVSEEHLQDLDYFGKITKEMDGGGREALLAELLAMDLSDFNIRRIPQNDALAAQKAFSRKGVDRLVEIIAMRGTLPNAHSADRADTAVTSGEEDNKGFYVSAKRLVPDLKRYTDSIQISKGLTKEWECQRWHSGSQRGIVFPTLARLRELFEDKHGVQDWPEEQDIDNREAVWVMPVLMGESTHD